MSIAISSQCFDPTYGVLHFPGKPVEQVRRKPMWTIYGELALGNHEWPDVDAGLSNYQVLRWGRHMPNWLMLNSKAHGNLRCILLDIGHGKYDQHTGWLWDAERGCYVYMVHPQEKNASASRLVADSLFSHGEMPHLPVLDYVDRVDLKGYRGNRDREANRRLLDPVFKSLLDYTDRRNHDEVLALMYMAFDQAIYTYGSKSMLEDHMVDTVHLGELMNDPAKRVKQAERAIPWILSPADYLRRVREAIKRRQTEFIASKELLANLVKDPAHCITFTEGGEERQIIWVTSDTRAIGSASRDMKLAGILKSGSTTSKRHPGNMQLFVNCNESYCQGDMKPINALPLAVQVTMLTHQRRDDIDINDTLQDPVRFLWSQSHPDDGVFKFAPGKPQKSGAPSILAIMLGTLTQGESEFVRPVITPAEMFRLANTSFRHADNPDQLKRYPIELQESEEFKKLVAS